jgi:hypothetical protein
MSLSCSTLYNEALLQRGRASEEACEGDAWPPQTEEGRGDRRNVQGELPASDEP